MAVSQIDRALVLAAGFGKRMRPLTEICPKPLIPFAGKPLLDHVLDRLAAAGVSHAIVNVHYLAEQIESHLRSRGSPEITISDEREQILDTGGAVSNVRASLGGRAFFVHNSDSVWIEDHDSTLDRMVRAWNEEVMDSLLLLAPVSDSLGYSGQGDFHLDSDGTVRRRKSDETANYVFAGVSINHPRLFSNEPVEPYSINRIWDRALENGRLAAIDHKGLWMHIGTAEALAEAEKQLRERNAA